MPTVARVRNVRVVIYANDHPPPHVHAIRRGGAWARLALNCPDGPVTLIDQSGFRLAEISAIGEMVAANMTAICEQWRRIHG
jgi:Domain of unknown function (DUF4160)